ncbi:hypothetical protein CO057_01380 [Candidatus Uhrbacteria bacterium CG_4_9_14_0_2_um_filter_41_50]|uniref:Uncharacterized protein n=1 Tax=Candidatus Uhrbacteria bacterium CG_4_9_14_0_2_um_filter_41_50 TaxID=1975031 RepID=A0A2M8EPU6_9BACT|nr:MAG: hypothetical protein COY24_02685 [Candidatus Uhrbacteria bacterium CG_4_10_14_0_2_um_filter_41_21]PJC24697.1 MAG: hypothetical protein CO057_01380 [Candidatus Uhrbacteria bacterium CG_4_9_14_0_2_um_filter_41_50]PJE75439.1 MAG: hypothetical protein COV03_00030 [Candidatus Uhrbacteria bacterium CG10_big_fil_rev_8_21_14_0_10_41_26]
MGYLLLLIFFPLPAFLLHLFLVYKKNYKINWVLLWPLMVGVFAGLIYGAAEGTFNAPAAIATGFLMILFVQWVLMLVTVFVLRLKKRCSTTCLLLVFALTASSFLVLRILDMTFITTSEMGEKGNAWYYSKYPDWRILD